MFPESETEMPPTITIPIPDQTRTLFPPTSNSAPSNMFAKLNAMSTPDVGAAKMKTSNVNAAASKTSKAFKRSCVPCADGKRKCSGEHPICQRCARIGRPCHYEERKRKQKSKSPKEQMGDGNVNAFASKNVDAIASAGDSQLSGSAVSRSMDSSLSGSSGGDNTMGDMQFGHVGVENYSSANEYSSYENAMGFIGPLKDVAVTYPKSFRVNEEREFMCPFNHEKCNGECTMSAVKSPSYVLIKSPEFSDNSMLSTRNGSTREAFTWALLYTIVQSYAVDACNGPLCYDLRRSLRAMQMRYRALNSCGGGDITPILVYNRFQEMLASFRVDLDSYFHKMEEKCCTFFPFRQKISASLIDDFCSFQHVFRNKDVYTLLNIASNIDDCGFSAVHSDTTSNSCDAEELSFTDAFDLKDYSSRKNMHSFAGCDVKTGRMDKEIMTPGGPLTLFKVNTMADIYQTHKICEEFWTSMMRLFDDTNSATTRTKTAAIFVRTCYNNLYRDYGTWSCSVLPNEAFTKIYGQEVVDKIREESITSFLPYGSSVLSHLADVEGDVLSFIHEQCVKCSAAGFPANFPWFSEFPNESTLNLRYGGQSARCKVTSMSRRLFDETATIEELVLKIEPYL